MTDYPTAIKSFYMKQNEETSDGGSVGYKGCVAPGSTMQGTDVFFPQIGEIMGQSPIPKAILNNNKIIN